MSEEILDSQARAIDEQLSTKLIRKLEISIIICLGLLFLSSLNALYTYQNMEAFGSVLFIDVLGANLVVYMLWFKGQTTTYDADINTPALSFSRGVQFMRILSIITGIMFVLITLTIPFAWFDSSGNGPEQTLLFWILNGLFFLFFAFLSFLFIYYPIATFSRAKKVNAVALKKA